MADASRPGSELVSLDVVKTLLKVQEDSFKLFVTSITSEFNSKILQITKDVADLRLEHSQAVIDDLKKDTSPIDTIQDDMEGLKQSINNFDHKIDYLENQSRRNNIRVSGIPEDSHESWERTEAKVKAMFETNLNLKSDEIEIERVQGRLLLNS